MKGLHQSNGRGTCLAYLTGAMTSSSLQARACRRSCGCFACSPSYNIQPIAEAGSLTLAWDANTELNVGGYTSTKRHRKCQYTNNVNVGNVTTWTVNGLTDGQALLFRRCGVRPIRTAGLLSAEVDDIVPASDLVFSDPREISPRDRWEQFTH